jgi:hypothetical protein
MGVGKQKCRDRRYADGNRGHFVNFRAVSDEGNERVQARWTATADRTMLRKLESIYWSDTASVFSRGLSPIPLQAGEPCPSFAVPSNEIDSDHHRSTSAPLTMVQREFLQQAEATRSTALVALPIRNALSKRIAVGTCSTRGPPPFLCI